MGVPTLGAAGAWQLAPGEYYSEIRGGFFSSDTYHHHDGFRRYLAGGGLHEERSLLSYNELGWTNRLSFIVGIPVLSVTRRTLDDPQPPTATGFGDALVGLRFGLANGRTAMALELDWKAPLSYERDRSFSRQDSIRFGDATGDGDSLDANLFRTGGEPRLGDGQQDLTLALHVGTALTSRGFVEASGGYRYRFEDPEDQIVVAADAGFWLSNRLLLGGRYLGEIAASEGPRLTDAPTRHRAGPTLLLRVDEHIDFFVASLHTAAAENALHTDEYYVGVSFKQTRLDRLQGFLGGSTQP
jgi:hypothetical protein